MMKLNWKKLDLFLLPALAATILALVYPGDTVWLGDEAGLMALAYNANMNGEATLHGLPGPFGIAYAPLAIWINQILLLFTSNPIVVNGVQTALLLAASWGAIWKLARTLHLPVGPGAAFFFCSPFVWFYLRMPWDNIFLMPLSLWFAVFLAQYLQKGRFIHIIGALVLLIIMFYLHPVAAALFAGFATGILCFRRNALTQEWKKFAIVGGATLLALSPWFFALIRNHAAGATGPILPTLETLGGTLTSFRNLTGWGFTDRFAPETGLTLFGTLLQLAIPVILFFVALGVIAVIRSFRRGEAKTFDKLCVCGMAAILAFVLLIPLLRIEHQVHHNSAILFAWMLLGWRGFAAFRSDYRRLATGLLAGAMVLQLAFLVDFQQQVRTNAGGASQFFGATLTQQWAVARNLAAAHIANPELSVDIQVEHLRQNPLPLQMLIVLAMETKLPELGFYRQAILLPSRLGSGVDLLLLEQPME